MNRMLHPCLLQLIFNVICSASTPDFTTKIHHLTPVSDTIDPVIFCPNSQIINLAPLDCDTVINYVVTAFDNLDQVILIQLEGIASGSAFPTGATVNTYLATDLAGNTATCSFSITAFEPLTQPLCRAQTNVLLNTNCSKNLKAFDILEGGPYGCPLHFIIEVDKTLPFNNGPWTTANFGAADINQQYQVRVTSLLTNAHCFGNIVIRDSVPPVVSCQEINVPCALPLEQLTPVFLRDSFGISFATPNVTDACSGNMYSITFADVQQNLPCDDVSTVSGIIKRTWSATDAYGNVGTCEQIIKRNRLLANVQIPGAKTTSCSSPDLSLSTNGRPFLQFINHHYELTPASYCEFDIDYFDTIRAGNCAGNYTVERTWKIYDACLPLSATNPKIGIQNIEVFDNRGPVIHCPADMIVTVNSVNCRAAVDLPDVFLSGNCSAINTIQAFWTDSSFSKTLLGNIVFNSDSSGVDTLGVLGIVSSFPVGTTTLLYTSEDACGNNGACTFNLTVANMTTPVAKCDTLLLVGLPTNGYLDIPAIVLDNGSTDDCSPLEFKAKLAETNVCNTQTLLSDTIQVCCHNSGDTLTGTLRVYDIAVPFGTVSNTYGTGHYKDCTFKIRVSGTNAPTCVAPANITVSCESFDPTLQVYGGLISQSCAVDSLSILLNYTNFDTTCNRGTITRLFRVFSENGQVGQCSQVIKVNYNQEYFVHFPDDVIVTVCDTTGNYGAPSFFGNDCELFTIEHEDLTFTVVPDACYKIERTWTIVNWCKYDPDLPLVNIPNPSPNPVTNAAENLIGPIVSPIQTAGDPWKASLVKLNPNAAVPTDFSIFYDANTNGYQYKQIIKIIDTQKPVVENCPMGNTILQDQTSNDAALWNASYWFDPVHVSSDLCEGPSELSITASDACSKSNLTISYQLFLDLNGDNIRETIVNSANLPPNNTVYFNNVSGVGQARQFDFRLVPANQKWGFAMEESVTGNKKTASVRFNTYSSPNTYLLPQLPHGNHKIKWIVVDACGNESTCEYNFTVRDGKAPTVACHSNLSVNLQQAGTIQIWATDFLQFTSDNCTPTEYLELGVRKAGTGSGFPLDISGNPIESLVFDCNEIGTQNVELWSRDKAGNAGSCTASIMIMNANGANCGDPIHLSGKVKTEQGDGISGVNVLMQGSTVSTPNFTFTDVTDLTGLYEFFDNVPIGTPFTITPNYNANPLNGLTTYDLVLISKHILGIEPLGSPYKMIAADANKSNSITTFDIVEYRKLILGITQELPNNKSWRFVPKDSLFANPQNPFQSPIPEVINEEGAFSNLLGVDFIGIKTGDVNNTAMPNATAAPESRSEGKLWFDVSANGRDELRAGEIVDIAFRSEEEVLGGQFTLNLNGVEVLEIVPGANLEAENFALFPDKNALTMAWEKGGTAAFSLKCRTSEAGNLREMFSVGSRITKAEAYRNNEIQQVQRLDPVLRFPDMPTFELFQNHPNPFAGATEITFNLPEASDATLKITDVNGRILFTQSANYERGTHTITLEKSALDASGILYYQLETPRYSAMRKMVKI